jgi:hypothetical protein
MTDFALSERLVGFLLDLFAAFVTAWFFAKYYPRWVDYRARQSEYAAAKRRETLQHALDRYEECAKDVKTFMGMLFREAVLCLTAFIAVFVCGTFILFIMIFQSISCHFANNCLETRNIKVYLVGGAMYLAMLITTVVYLIIDRRFRLETSPDSYRSVMKRRIARLNNRSR